ncbi:hypothetical protein AAGS40_26970 (plasmid) [Paraburkholderia sp. PREW-6R]|uniref:AtuA-related protein n=1 Tax=Paraburkholderia sp. PREW-6R TaxID=3141544 RepID=UPI0031F4AF4F
MKRTTLREIAHCRSGEKGNDSNVSVIAYRSEDYPLLVEALTVEAVTRLYGPITKGTITRYLVPRVGGMNFVLRDVLEGGRSRTLAFEESGKALSSLMLTMPLDVPDSFVERSADVFHKNRQAKQQETQ